MFCKNCGKEIAEDTKFCPNCGAATDSSVISESVLPENIKYPKPAIAILSLILGSVDVPFSVFCFFTTSLPFLIIMYLSAAISMFLGIKYLKACPKVGLDVLKTYEGKKGEEMRNYAIGGVVCSGTAIGVMVIALVVVIILS